MSAEARTVGRYRLCERVGSTANGVLYRAIDDLLDREVTVKVMSTDFGSAENADEARSTFFREAQLSAALQHRNIVTVFESAEDAGTPYLVMEFLRGRTLAERMTGGTPLPLADKLDVVAEMCTGLQYGHDHGVLHRGVRPDNVWILDDGAVKLCNFGIAKLFSSTVARQDDVSTTANYMSPEQVLDGALDGRTDIFAAGVVLFELLTNRRPFEAGSATATLLKVVREEPPALEPLLPGLPHAVVDSVNRALRKDPEERYQSAADFAADLQLIRMSLDGDTEPATVFTRPQPPATTRAVPAYPSRDAPSTSGRDKTAPVHRPTVQAKRAQPSQNVAPRSRAAYNVAAWLLFAILVLASVAVACWNRSGPSGLGSTEGTGSQPPSSHAEHGRSVRA